MNRIWFGISELHYDSMEGWYCCCCSLGWDWWCCIITWHNNVIFVSHFGICINDVIFDGFIWQNILKKFVAYQAGAVAATAAPVSPRCLRCMKFKYPISLSFPFFEFIFHSSMARSLISHLALRLPHFPAEHSFTSLFFFSYARIPDPSLSLIRARVCIFLVQSLALHGSGSARHGGIRRFDGIWNKKYWQKK